MSYFLEIWLRGYAEDYLRSISDARFHPHITLVRPFEPRNSKEIVKQTIEEVCKGVEPIPFEIEGVNTFEQGVTFANITHADQLLTLDNKLEEAIHPHVYFEEAYSETKKLHATIKSPKDGIHVPRIQQYMLRLTVLREKKIWFSYDLVQDKSLSRVESINKQIWNQTVLEFQNKYKKRPTKNGFVDV
jgi:hypothetical protein